MGIPVVGAELVGGDVGSGVVGFEVGVAVVGAIVGAAVVGVIVGASVVQLSCWQSAGHLSASVEYRSEEALAPGSMQSLSVNLRQNDTLSGTPRQLRVGTLVGKAEGPTVGLSDGLPVGNCVGGKEGLWVGTAVGLDVVGDRVGL